ncbi:MAG: trypsin-like peptidase domain-containing protein [Planctomycetota bacterium]|jgi:serine protease Do
MAASVSYRCTLLLAAALAGSLNAASVPVFDRQTPVVTVYAKTHKAVVNISGERPVARRSWSEFYWPPRYDARGPRFQQQIPVLGSGFVVHENGFIVTNAHVVEGVDRIKVVFSNGREYRARVVSAEASKDLAVLAIEANEQLPFIELGRSSDLMIGETVIAIGNPYGYANTVTSGVVSAVGRDLHVTDAYWLRGLIQTDASINPGNSGGPLLNINGQLIGINTAIRAEAENIGFAIPVDTLVENLSQMLMPEKLRRVRLGLTVGRMTKDGRHEGLAVDAVSKDSPADQNGLSADDLILEMDGHRLHSVIDFYVKMMNKEVGEPIRLKYVRPRGGRPKSGVAELALLPRPLADGRRLARRLFQMDISPLTTDMARRFDFESAYPILIVTAIDPNGTAARAGIHSGDLILQVDDTTVRDEPEFSRVMENVSEGDSVELRILRITLGLFGQIDRRLRVRVQARPPGGAP